MSPTLHTLPYSDTNRPSSNGPAAVKVTDPRSRPGSRYKRKLFSRRKKNPIHQEKIIRHYQVAPHKTVHIQSNDNEDIVQKSAGKKYRLCEGLLPKQEYY